MNVQLLEGTRRGPLDVLARQRIADRLRSALRIAKTDFPRRAEAFRAALLEALDHADAWALVAGRKAAACAARPVFELRNADGAGSTVEPVREWLLIPFGQVRVERPLHGGDFVFTRRHAESARRWFERMGRKLAIDYEHQSWSRLNARPDGLSPAAGWIGGLEVRDDGLWAIDVCWTERARDLLRSGEYKYFSPVIFWTDEDHTDVAALGPVALTNDPAMRGVTPLAAGRLRIVPRSDDLPAAASAGVFDPSIGRDAAALATTAADEGERPAGDDAPRSMRVEADSAQAPEADSAAPLAAAQRQLAALRQQLQAQQAEAFIESGLRLGKIVESTRADWREDFLQDAARAEDRLRRAPVLLAPGRIVARKPDAAAWCGRTGTPAPYDLVAMRRLGIEPEDLEAYARAVAAGQVHGHRQA